MRLKSSMTVRGTAVYHKLQDAHAAYRVYKAIVRRGYLAIGTIRRDQ